MVNVSLVEENGWQQAIVKAVLIGIAESAWLVWEREAASLSWSTKRLIKEEA